MPFRKYKCEKCGEEITTKRESPKHCETVMECQITAPETTFMEKKSSGKSYLKDQQKILKARARKYSRDVEMDDLITTNEKEVSHKAQWLKPSGEKRKAIDDL